MKAGVIEILENPDKKSVRVAFDFKGLAVVVKLLRPENEEQTGLSVKFFKPEKYQKTKSYWMTTEPVSTNSDVGRRLVRDAADELDYVLRRACSGRRDYGDVKHTG